MTEKIRIPLDEVEGDFDLEVHLVCAICRRRMKRAPRYDRGEDQAFVCPGSHPSTPVHLKVKVGLDGVDPADA